MPSFTVHCPPATAEELSSLRRVIANFYRFLCPVLMVSSRRWIPDNVSVTLCSVPPVGHKQAATCLANTTAIQELFTRSLAQVCRSNQCRHTSQ